MVAWTPLSDGTNCGTGKVCNSQTCQSGCWIVGTYYAADVSNAANKCQTCQPAVSTTSWTSLSEGASCASGQVCHSGTCQSGCWIGSAYYAADAGIPSRPCQACKPGVSTTAWTMDAAACGCTGSLQALQDSTGTCVANMATIPASPNYSIDSTEVTRSQYSTWLATTTAATVSGQDSATCSWNTTFAPDSDCMASGQVCQSNCNNHPQVCVDWCDAYAYCKGVGKRLCGKIGGGMNAYGDSTNAGLSAWYRACSSGGSNSYPYGTTYNGKTCNGYDYWDSDSSTMKTLAVGTLTGCQAASPYAGVYDLSGNVWEWEDSCDSIAPARWAYCRILGGSFNSDSDYLRCGVGNHYSRSYVSYVIGFRCCSP
jgi:formylglycine-generating enzyme